MVEHLRPNGLSPFAENVNGPGQAVTPADLRNLMGFQGLREGDQGRGEGKDSKIGVSGREHPGARGWPSRSVGVRSARVTLPVHKALPMRRIVPSRIAEAPGAGEANARGVYQPTSGVSAGLPLQVVSRCRRLEARIRTEFGPLAERKRTRLGAKRIDVNDPTQSATEPRT
jgi:hypothetical protein